jgi:hypothetical protein
MLSLLMMGWDVRGTHSGIAVLRRWLIERIADTVATGSTSSNGSGGIRRARRLRVILSVKAIAMLRTERRGS